MQSPTPTVHSIMHADATNTVSKLSKEIDFVQSHIDKVIKNKEDQMHAIEERKRKLKQAAGSGMPAVLLEQNIRGMMTNNSELLDQVNKLISEARSEKKNIDLTNEAVTLMDREIARIQADHDKGLLELRDKREQITNKIKSILEVDEMIADIEVKIAADMRQYTKDVEEAEAVKFELTQRDDADNFLVQSQIRDMEAQIGELGRRYTRHIEFMQKQKTDIEFETEAILQNINRTVGGLFVGNIENYMDEIRRLEELRMNASPSQLSSLDRAIAFYHSRIAEANLRKNMTITERINEFMDLQGLVISDTGEIRDADGKLLTKLMIHENGLLDALDKYIIESYGFHYLDNTRLLTPDGNVLTREQAQALGLLPQFDLVALLFIEESIRSDLSSRDSDLPSEDAFYLKKYLGVPLTLALAEITAKQPGDPIHYLGHWLFKYRYNQEVEQTKKQEVDQLTNMRNTIAKEKWDIFLQEEAVRAVLEIVERAEIQGDANEIKRELQRIAEETDTVENVEDQDALEEEAKDTLGEYNGPTVNKRGSTRT